MTAKSATVKSADDHYLTARQLAKYLGYSEYSIRSMVSRKKLPMATKIGGSLRFKRSDVDSWIAKQNPGK